MLKVRKPTYIIFQLIFVAFYSSRLNLPQSICSCYLGSDSQLKSLGVKQNMTFGAAKKCCALFTPMGCSALVAEGT
jgi:hypothetical protein